MHTHTPVINLSADRRCLQEMFTCTCLSAFSKKLAHIFSAMVKTSQFLWAAKLAPTRFTHNRYCCSTSFHTCQNLHRCSLCNDMKCLKRVWEIQSTLSKLLRNLVLFSIKTLPFTQSCEIVSFTSSIRDLLAYWDVQVLWETQDVKCAHSAQVHFNSAQLWE